MASPEIALENLLLAVLDSAEKAREADDEAALFAYHDVLDIGLSEARDNGVAFKSARLRKLDPYALMARKNAKT